MNVRFKVKSVCFFYIWTMWSYSHSRVYYWALWLWHTHKEINSTGWHSCHVQCFINQRDICGHSTTEYYSYILVTLVTLIRITIIYQFVWIKYQMRIIFDQNIAICRIGDDYEDQDSVRVTNLLWFPWQYCWARPGGEYFSAFRSLTPMEWDID